MLPKQKFSKKDTAITIKRNFQAGMKPIDIANLFKISKQIVNYHIHHGMNERKTRRTKLNRNEKNLIFKWAKDRPISLASEKNYKEDLTIYPKKKKKREYKKEYLYPLLIELLIKDYQNQNK